LLPSLIIIIDGIENNEGVVVIATKDHLLSVNKVLTQNGFGVDALQKRGQYIPKDIDKILKEFMVNGWPDEIFSTAPSGIC
jgi:hypothetical protein